MMTRSIVFALFAISVPLLLDYYVFRNWRRFARERPRLRWTVPVYRVMLLVMPFTMPAYTLSSNWWEVEPKLARALFIGFWMTYYVPKLILALALLLKDALRAAGWLAGRFRRRLLPEAATPPGPAGSARTSRRQFLQTVGWSAAGLPYVLVGYSSVRTLYDFEIHRLDVPLAGLPRALDGLTIAQLSDLHAGSFFSTRPMERAVDLVQSLRPDLTVITGDFVNHDAAEMALILPAMRRLKADLGVYGCLGNHDHYAHVGDVAAHLRATPVDLLVNEHRTVTVDRARLHLVGTDNTGFSQHYADLPRALDGLAAHPHGEEIRILLAHTPTYWDAHVLPGHPDVALMLCGHTHGGQVGFEWGPLGYSLAQVAYPRWAGLYEEPRADGQGRQFLYVNRGIGTVGPPLRLGIRPEITLLTLRSA